LFMEARPGWVNEDGHAEGAVPGFGLTEITGVRETSIDPAKEVLVRWGSAEFTGTSFAEHFSVMDQNAHVLATFSGGSAAAYEHKYGKGSAILLGTLAGQANEAKPTPMHPLGEILTMWAGLTTPDLKVPPLMELREMDSPKGHLIFLFNHGDAAAHVEFAETLPRPGFALREIITGQSEKFDEKRFSVSTEIPTQSVRIYRIDY
jgi:hypothetical protein